MEKLLLLFHYVTTMYQ